jgi:hypothetical protein
MDDAASTVTETATTYSATGAAHAFTPSQAAAAGHAGAGDADGDGHEVVLGGAESFGAAGLMYLVFVVDLATLDPDDADAMDLVGQVPSHPLLSPTPLPRLSLASPSPLPLASPTARWSGRYRRKNNSSHEEAFYVAFALIVCSSSRAPRRRVNRLLPQAASQIGCYASLQDIRDMWASGGDGLCLFHADDDKFSVAVGPPPGSGAGTEPLREVGATDWSEEVTLGVVSASKKGFQLVHKASGRAEQVGL